MFFLLATFMMVSMSLVKNKGIQVNLPSAATAAPRDAGEFSTITVAKDGALFLNKERIRREELPARLRALRASTPDPKVLINGDENSYFGEAVYVLDEARKQGIKKVSIQTRGKENSK